MLKQNTKAIGDLAELKVACDLTEKGYVVSKPIGDNAPYDMIVDFDGKLKRVQVKARSERNHSVAVELRSCMRNYTHQYDESEWDILAVYNIDGGQIAYLDWVGIGDNTTVKFRTQLPKNNQKVGVRLFEDYSSPTFGAITI